MTGILLLIVILQTVVIAALIAKTFRVKYDGTMVVRDTEEKKVFTLEFDDTDPDTFDKKKQIVLKVVNTPNS